MPKQCLVSQLYTNYITKNYFINGLLFQDHVLKFHDIFVTFSASKYYFRTFQLKEN